MARGGARPGAGRPKGGQKADSAPVDADDRPLPNSASVPDVNSPRPTFQTAHEFAIWAMNAPDAEVSMELKIRTMQVLAPLEAKQPKPDTEKPAVATGKFAPRMVKGFDVFSGGRQ